MSDPSFSDASQRVPAPHRATDAERFFSFLASDYPDNPNLRIELRAFPPKGSAGLTGRREWFPLTDAGAHAAGKWSAGYATTLDVYQGALPRCGRAGGADDVLYAGLLWCEIDDDQFGPDGAIAFLDERMACGVVPDPHAVIVSGGGIHVYWRLSAAFPLVGDVAQQRFRSVLARLIAAMNSDLPDMNGAHAGIESKDIPRILRVPGTFNHKRAEPRKVVIHELRPGRDRYPLTWWEEQLPQLEEKPAPVISLIPRTEGNGHERTPQEWLAWAMDRSATGRNNAGFNLACQLRDDGYTEDEARSILAEYQGYIGNDGDHPYTIEESQFSVREAYRSPAREPIPSAGVECKPPSGKHADNEEDDDEPPDSPFSELALARGFAKESTGSFAFFEGAQWWHYKSGQWSHSSPEIIEIEAQRYLEKLQRSGNPRMSVTARKVSNVLKLSRAHLGVHRMAEFNCHPMWIALKNGVFDVEANTLIPHSPDHYLTTQAAFAYDPMATCPRWEQFMRETMLTEAGDPCEEWVNVLQEWFGYCLVPDNSAQVAMVWLGEGANGKGVATRMMQKLIPEHTAVSIDKLDDPYQRAMLYGKLLGLINEPQPRAMEKNGAYFKAITGMDTIDARRPTENYFHFVPKIRFVISCNDVPGTKDYSRGYFRRLLMVKWRLNLKESEKDTKLEDDYLDAELPGIFNWAIEGLRRFRERGSRFPELEESNALLGAYKLSQDTVAQFVEESCEKCDDGKTPGPELFHHYLQWCQRNNIKSPAGRDAFGKQLTRLGFPSSVPVREGGRGNQAIRYREGIVLVGSLVRANLEDQNRGLF